MVKPENKDYAAGRGSFRRGGEALLLQLEVPRHPRPTYSRRRERYTGDRRLREALYASIRERCCRTWNGSSAPPAGRRRQRAHHLEHVARPDRGRGHREARDNNVEWFFLPVQEETRLLSDLPAKRAYVHAAALRSVVVGEEESAEYAAHRIPKLSHGDAMGVIRLIRYDLTLLVQRRDDRNKREDLLAGGAGGHVLPYLGQHT